MPPPAPTSAADFELIDKLDEADEELLSTELSELQIPRPTPLWKRKRFLIPVGVTIGLVLVLAVALRPKDYQAPEDEAADFYTDDPLMNPLPKNYQTAIQQHVIDQFGHVRAKWKPIKPPLPDHADPSPSNPDQLSPSGTVPSFPDISNKPVGGDYSYGTGKPPADNDVIIIDSFFFVFVDEDGKAGNLPNSILQAQIDRMNLDWRDVPFQFRFAGVQRWQSGYYFHNTYHDSHEDFKMKEKAKEMKAKFRPKDAGPHQLFIYTCNLGKALNGFATWPWDYATQTPEDGLVIHYETLPGVSEMTGNTASHEMGHWMGLFHTFKGGCDGPGDYVNDTKPEMKNNNDNPDCLPRNTCPTSGPEPDPIFNLMDYGICRQEFTPGQATRMVQFWNACRSGFKDSTCTKPM